MDKKQIYQLSVVLVLSVAAIEIGCSRPLYLSAPRTFNGTSTFTAVMTPTWTMTSGGAATNTVTATSTNTPISGTTSTFTNTPTSTATFTITDTPTFSDTPTNTMTATVPSTPTPTPTAVTFTFIYTNYIQPNSCINCHSASGFPGPPDPSSPSNFYNSVVNQPAPDGCASLLVDPGNAGQSALYLRLSGTGCSPQMPESGGFFLNANQLANVAAWINAGALNN